MQIPQAGHQVAPAGVDAYGGWRRIGGHQRVRANALDAVAAHEHRVVVQDDAISDVHDRRVADQGGGSRPSGSLRQGAPEGDQQHDDLAHRHAGSHSLQDRIQRAAQPERHQREIARFSAVPRAGRGAATDRDEERARRRSSWHLTHGTDRLGSWTLCQPPRQARTILPWPPATRRTSRDAAYDSSTRRRIALPARTHGLVQVRGVVQQGEGRMPPGG